MKDILTIYSHVDQTDWVVLGKGESPGSPRPGRVPKADMSLPGPQRVLTCYLLYFCLVLLHNHINDFRITILNALLAITLLSVTYLLLNSKFNTLSFDMSHGQIK